MSDYPDRDFTYGGVLIDLGDLYVDGNTDENHADNYLGNTHGGMLNIGEDWYIFYHRQTNRTSYARQACAEKLERTPDGGFKQARLTSCGLNGGPLKGRGTYEARIACHLWAKGHTTGRVDGKNPKKRLEAHPYFTQTGKDREGNGDQYIANMRDRATAGFKFFEFDGTEAMISVKVRGKAEGEMHVFDTPDFQKTLARIPVSIDGKAAEQRGIFSIEKGVRPLYFMYAGSGAVDFISFTIK